MRKGIRRRALVAAAGATLALATLPSPSYATVDADACRIMGPNYVEGVVGCACSVLSLIGETGLPPGPQVCFS